MPPLTIVSLHCTNGLDMISTRKVGVPHRMVTAIATPSDIRRLKEHDNVVVVVLVVAGRVETRKTKDPFTRAAGYADVHLLPELVLAIAGFLGIGCIVHGGAVLRSVVNKN